MVPSFTGGEKDGHPKMKKIKMLALDLDGTLLTKKKELTPGSRRVLEAAAGSGIHVVPVTGRPLSGLPENVLEIPGIRYVITSNGAVTSDLASGEKLRTALLPCSTAEEILEIPVTRGLIHNVFIDGTGYCEPAYFELQWQFFRDTPVAEYVRKSRRVTEDLAGLIRSAGDGIENIWIMACDRNERDGIEQLIRERWPVQTVLTAERDVEIGNPDADKGKALEDLAARLHIEKEQIMAVGDNENDLGMFRAAGISAAMGNASDAVRQAADLVTGTNEEDGAAAVIRQILKRQGQIWEEY